jgi:isopenicillin N synthase-like dioxygenase
MRIPVIDIAPFTSPDPADRQRVARQWDEAFSTIGFAAIAGHGIPEPLMTDVHAVAHEFFARPHDEKMALHGPPGLGYEGFQEAKLAQSKGGGAAPADLVEALMIQGPEWDRRGEMPPDAPANLWPAVPARFRATVGAYVAEAFALGQTLMRISAMALGLEEGFFGPYYDRMMHNLRLAHYPDQPELPLPGQFRNGPHTDFTGFTILRQDSAPGGLQVLSPDGAWIDVLPIPGTLVINSGDLLQRWTNDRWRSNLHRVQNPARALIGSTARLSIVMFTGPNPDAVVECLPTCAQPGNPARYGPVKAIDYLMMKIAETFA